MEFRELTITVVGLGVIGGSMAMALRRLSPKKIFGVDKDINTLHEAKLRGIIDEGYVDCEEPLQNSDFVIVALYPKTTIQFIIDNNEKFKKGCIIIDTAGIKRSVVETIQSSIREDIEFLGTHPMAGKAEYGFYHADYKIFSDANCIITPTDRNSAKNMNFVNDIYKAMGVKNIIELSPEEHDKIIAYTSQLPHVLAVSMINSKDTNKDIAKLVGGSFKDATRVAAINSELWYELFCDNREYLVAAIEAFEMQTRLMKEAILNCDREALMAGFDAAKALRKEIV